MSKTDPSVLLFPFLFGKKQQLQKSKANARARAHAPARQLPSRQKPGESSGVTAAPPPPRTCCVSTTTPGRAGGRACVRARGAGRQTDRRTGGQKDAPQVGRPPPTSRADGARADEALGVVTREGGGG